MRPPRVQRVLPITERNFVGVWAACLIGFLLASTIGRCEEPGAISRRVVEIARGHSWVSPYWGYCAPKIACDGRTYYTTGLWGDSPENAEGVVYEFTGHAWAETYRFSDVYQPAILVLDSQRRLIVIYSRQEQPAIFLRASKPGIVSEFDELPPPPNMPNAFYIGAAIREDELYVAYVTTPSYSMHLAVCDLTRGVWRPSFLLSAGQVAEKPKTAWTYPILIPVQNGLHVVASNCPDGGEGNTYNQVRYAFVPQDSSQAIRHELVSESPVGCNAYAMDAVVDRAGVVHIVHMWNVRKYGPELMPGSGAPGVYHAWRDAETGAWKHTRLGDTCIAGLYLESDRLFALMQESGAIVLWNWDSNREGWTRAGPLCDVAEAPVPPTFMDVIHPAGGSDISCGIAMVTDGTIPPTGERVLWSILPH